MGDPLLTVLRLMPRLTEGDGVHPPLEVVHRVRVSPIRTARRASGIRCAAPALFSAPRGLFLFLTDSMFLVFLPTPPPSGRDVAKARQGHWHWHAPSPQCLF